MLSVSAAKAKILESQTRATPCVVPLSEALGLILAEDIFSKVNLPVFDSSAMDGFALCFSDTLTASDAIPVVLKEVEEIWAGKTPQQKVMPGCCARIMTGAKMPLGADTVVMREQVTAQDGFVTFVRPASAGENVRKVGEEIHAGDQILTAGRKLNATAIAVLAASGVSKVNVYPRPLVSLIPTGSELKCPGETLSHAQIYESNSFALRAALAEIGIVARVFPIIPDDEKLLREAATAALTKSTHVIITGGVSVGDYDYNRSVLSDCGVSEVFWRVAQKPGKPLYVGKCAQTLVFGLPGNPASSLVCFYEYVLPALLQFMGRTNRSGLAVIKARLTSDYTKKSGLTHFIRGRAVLQGNQLVVSPHARQQSHMMTSFADANCLIEIPADAEHLAAGDVVEVHLLPGEESSCV